MRHTLQKLAHLACLCLLVMLIPSGCAALGVLAHAVPQPVHPKYVGLVNQSIGVMVWADQGVLIDWPMMQLDLANAVQKKLQAALVVDKADELKGTTYPVQPASIVRYQHDHPGLEYQPIGDVAPRLGVSRLIYIEVQDFHTRPEQSLEMYRGQIVATVRVIEIENGKATTPYVENDVKALYPKKASEVGVTNIGDYRAYVGAIDEFSTEVKQHFVTHDSED